MKKSLIALAVIAATGTAMAQSSVTLYGLVDANVQGYKAPVITVSGSGFASSSLTNARIQSGGQNGSRFGLKGSEDLGGGLNAVFTLESGFNVDDGSTAANNDKNALPLFSRLAFVGVNGAFGTLTVGRTNSAYDDVKGNVLVSTNSSTLDAAGGFLGASSAVNTTNATTGVVTPVNAGGFSLANAQAIANYNKTQTAANATAALSAYKNFAKSTGSWVGYAYTRFDNSIKFSTANYGGLTASVGYGFGEDKTGTVGATHNLALNTQYVNGPIGVVIAYQEETLAKTATATSYLKNTLVGGSYDFAIVKLFAAYNEAKFTGLEKQKEFALGVSVPVGAFTLRAEAARSKGDSLGKATGYDLEALYDLSKRTTLYSSYVTSKKEMLAGAGGVTTSIVAAGVRHKF